MSLLKSLLGGDERRTLSEEDIERRGGDIVCPRCDSVHTSLSSFGVYASVTRRLYCYNCGFGADIEDGVELWPAEWGDDGWEGEGIEAEVIDPDAPVRFVRLTVDGEEKAMIPWDEARAIADTVSEYPTFMGGRGGEE